MGVGQPSWTAFVGWHLTGLLSGIFAGEFWSPRHLQKEALREAIRRAAEAAVVQCKPLRCECKGEKPGKQQSTDHSSKSLSVWIWILGVASFFNSVVAVAGWCRHCFACCHRRQGIPAEEEGETSDSSPDSRRALAQEQLALIRRRRHGTR